MRKSMLLLGKKKWLLFNYFISLWLEFQFQAISSLNCHRHAQCSMFLHYIASNTKLNNQQYPFHYFQIEGGRRYLLWSYIMHLYSFFVLYVCFFFGIFLGGCVFWFCLFVFVYLSCLFAFVFNQCKGTQKRSILALKPEEGPLVLSFFNSSLFYPVNTEGLSWSHKMKRQVHLSSCYHENLRSVAKSSQQITHQSILRWV